MHMSPNIVVTNDDGFDADGLTVLFDRLVKAGHDIRRLAPAEPQTAQGSTSGGLEAIDSEVEESFSGQSKVAPLPRTWTTSRSRNWTKRRLWTSTSSRLTRTTTSIPPA
jgi:broad specificity polyphosphatase/5'/3'-nucleotidase SurE